MPDFETAFGEWIDGTAYDAAEDALFSVVRAAFTAGWIAAGGKAPIKIQKDGS